jgi:hypothetical protein
MYFQRARYIIYVALCPATKHQTAHLRVAVHKVGRPVHGVDDPRGVFGVRIVLGDGSATTLLADESVKVCIDLTNFSWVKQLTKSGEK